MSEADRAEKLLVPSEPDWISPLPDDILGHILGFLPADEAVKTCVLSRRWLHQWKFMRCLRITSHGVWKKGADDLNKFVTSLLLLRDPGSAIHKVELDVAYEPSDGDVAYPDMWIRHALLCQAQVLYITLFAESNLVFDVPPLVSSHLRILDLNFPDLNGNILDFSSCPSLEVLRITECTISTGKISSQSLEELSIRESCFCHDSRTHISVPNLVYLELVDCRGETPFLESITSLETAYLDTFSVDERSEEGDSRECCGTCAKCCGDDGHNSGCVFLGGLSSATYLKMITDRPGQIAFRRDLKWCPTFGDLKTLFLSDWCVEGDLRPLVCLLEHSPILEKLTLQLRKGPERTLGREEKYGLMEKSVSVSEHLKKVTVICEEVDQRVCKVLNFLSTFGINITIKRNGVRIPFEEVTAICLLAAGL